MQKRQANKRRGRKARIRRRNRMIAVIAVIVLVLGLLGLMLLFSEDEVKKETMVLYPMEYTSLIRENAVEQGLEPAYVAAVILAESSYNPNAVSSVNAQGLMQIMPDTGEWISGKFDEEYVEGCLFSPETNIKYGCWYLGYLMRRYDGDMRCSSAAYHSGQGKVDQWLSDPAYSADGKTLSVIPGSNADTYVNRVLEYYEKYDELYQADAAA